MFAKPKDPPARVGVSLATLDEPATLRPDMHVWVSEKLAWLLIEDGLPEHDLGPG
jgi:hypothetical protein